MVHKLKCWPEQFEAVVSGLKTAEMRLNDRDFKVGDQLLLREWVPYKHGRGYTGRKQLVEVTHMLFGEQFGVLKGFVCMSIRKVEK